MISSNTVRDAVTHECGVCLGTKGGEIQKRDKMFMENDYGWKKNRKLNANETVIRKCKDKSKNITTRENFISENLLNTSLSKNKS